MPQAGGDLATLAAAVLGAEESLDILADLDPETRSGSMLGDALGSLTALADQRLRLRCIIHWPTSPAIRDRVRADVFGPEIAKYGWVTRSLITIPSLDLLIVDGGLVHRWRTMPSGASHVMVTNPATSRYLKDYFNTLWADSTLETGRVLIYEDVVASSPEEYKATLLCISEDTWDRLIAELAANPSRLFALDGRRFEELVAELLARDGMEVQLTQTTRDGGRDILASTHDSTGHHLFLVECKRFSPARPIGVDIVRSLYGVVEQERATAGVLVTTSRFTADAKAFAAPIQYRMSLREYEELVAWIGRCVGRRGR